MRDTLPVKQDKAPSAKKNQPSPRNAAIRHDQDVYHPHNDHNTCNTRHFELTRKVEVFFFDVQQLLIRREMSNTWSSPPRFVPPLNSEESRSVEA